MLPYIAGWLDNLMSIVSKRQFKIEYKSEPVKNS